MSTVSNKAAVLLLAGAAACFAQRAVFYDSDRPVALVPAVAAPQPPFRFIEEDSSGSTAKVTVSDARGVRWSLKFGSDVKAETFATRFVRAMGYYADSTYFVRQGRISGVRSLGRADRYIDKHGRFRDARFEYRDPAMRPLKTIDWTWEKNPYVGTRELNGLKIVSMLLSNWDNKDARSAFGSNTGILERGKGPRREWIYYITDWGGSMGKWGNIITREKWDCEGFADQSKDFVKEIESREVKFGFSGQNTNSFKDDIQVRDVRWLMARLDRVSDSDLRSALRASGANSHEVEHFTRALRARINLLGKVSRLKTDAVVVTRSRRSP